MTDGAGEPYDLIVVGGGINGTGTARDAALRGLRTLLVERDDVASGTTAWSTRLIHGGLRYLEHAEIGLVRESLRERERLLRIAPHLVRPLSFFLPIYEGDDRGPLMIRAGMVAYDALSMDKSLDNHRMLSRDDALEREPGVRAEGLKGAAVYFDCQAEYPERIAVENTLSAIEAGADVRLRTAVTGLLREGDGRVTGVRLEDGAEVRGRVVANIAGPWADLVAGDVEHERLIGGTKGTHLVVSPFAGAPSEALYVEAADGRPYFIVPWQGCFLIGTTDTPYDGDLDRVVATEEEIRYLIGETNRVIPDARLERADVLHTYAGVRPLPHADEDNPGAVSRGHVVIDHAKEGAPGLLSIVGGKLTTYRNLAEDVVDDAVKLLDDVDAGPCVTGDRALPGGATSDVDAFADRFVADSRLDEAVARRLVRVYGSRAPAVLERCRREPGLDAPLDATTGALRGEVCWAIEEELAASLIDVLLRRTMVGLGPTAGIGPDEEAARVAFEHLGWDEARAAAEVAAYREHAKTMTPRALEAVPRD